MDYIAELVTRVVILGCAAMVVAYLADEAGILHVASAGLMGVGAYGSAFLAIHHHASVASGLAATIPLGAVGGVILHVFTRRLTSSYLAMGLLSIAVVLHGLMINWVSATGGPMGVADVPPLPLGSALRSAVLTAAALALGFGLMRLRATVFGSRVRAVRDDEILSRDLHLRPENVRLILLVGSSAALSLLGGLYAHHLRYLDPSSFALSESIAILAMACLLPMSNVMKGLLGAFVFVSLPEGLRFLGLPAAVAAQIRQALFGVLLLVMATRGRGIAPGGIARGAA